MTLAGAIDARKARNEEVRRFPPAMDRVRGDEEQQLDEKEKTAAKLKEALRDQRRDREAAAADLERTGLAQSIPADEEWQAITEKLRTLDQRCAARENTRADCARAEAALRDALAQLNANGDPPRLDADTFRRAENVAPPLIAAQKRLVELKEQLTLAGEPPAPSEIERQRRGVEALWAWLAGRAAEAAHPAAAPRWPLIAAAAAAAVAALTAALQGAWIAFAGALAAVVASGAALLLQRDRPFPAAAPTAEARRRFHETGLASPAQWEDQAVRTHLRDVIEARLNELTLQQNRAAHAEQIRLQIQTTEAEIEKLEQERSKLSSEIGFDPTLPAVEFHRFIHLCSEWDTARTRHDAEHNVLAGLDRDIAGSARLVCDSLGQWRADDAPSLMDASGNPDLELLRSAFDDLQKRHAEAGEARHRLRSCEHEIESLNQRLAEIDNDVESLFSRAGLEPGDRAALTNRLEQLPRWKAARAALDRAKTEEDLARTELAEQPDVVALVDEGKSAEITADLEASTRRASGHTRLIQRQAEIGTKLEEAGKDSKLEQAAAAEDRARQALEDKHDEVLLAAATSTLLDDVEQAFESEHEPDVLRRARAVFADVTARAFDLRLRPDGTFFAHDVVQDEPRTLAELSSGTRMQLLLALRLAWTEAQEQGGEALPLFLDEALTTSDEKRFAVMAQSLERIAGAENGRPRQIFYLSARRHERALWRAATGTEPAVIDLAAVRFPSEKTAPEDYRVEEPPPVPVPKNGESAEAYASRLGVPRFDPHQPPGGVHLFHLLRDDLPLLHGLMDAWRITSLGQLEVLLASDAAESAVATEGPRQRLGQRCRAVRAWIDLWCQGRGRPLDRGMLEECGAVSNVFIERTAALAEQLQGDGEALVRALRAGQLPRFHGNKVDDLERWLDDEGYTDDRGRLGADERRRLTLQRAAPGTEAGADDVNRVVSWMEAGAGNDG